MCVSVCKCVFGGGEGERETERKRERKREREGGGGGLRTIQTQLADTFLLSFGKHIRILRTSVCECRTHAQSDVLAPAARRMCVTERECVCVCGNDSSQSGDEQEISVYVCKRVCVRGRESGSERESPGLQ